MIVKQIKKSNRKIIARKNLDVQMDKFTFEVSSVISETDRFVIIDAEKFLGREEELLHLLQQFQDDDSYMMMRDYEIELCDEEVAADTLINSLLLIFL